MASNIPEERPNNTESGETLAGRMNNKKRSRRVSFADTEITSVHIFNPDDDDDSYDTPPNSKRTSSRIHNAADLETDAPVVGFFKDLTGGDSEDSGDDDDGRIVDARKSFLRPLGSPSPGSSTVGSVTSNDEDNFFGPVSASFIRPEQLFDSAASCENYEDTMDTTAFSMHYRSLVRSESGEEPKTPTAVSFAFGEKTPKTPPKVTNPIDSGGSFMEITEPKKLISPFLVPVGKARDVEDSNDMSIVEENPNRFDYGRLSPTTEALLASSSSYQNETGHVGQTNGRDSELGNSASHEKSAEAASVGGVELNRANGDCLDRNIDDCLSDNNCDLAAAASIDCQIQSPNRLTRKSKELPKDWSEQGISKLEFATVNSGTIQNMDIKDLQSDVCAQHEPACQHLSEGSIRGNSPIEGKHLSDIDQNFAQRYASPLEGSSLSLSSRGRQSIMTPNSATYLGIISSSKHTGIVSSNEVIKAAESISSIQKSISRFRIPNSSAPNSSLKEGIDKLKRRLSNYSSMPSPFTPDRTDNSTDLKSKYVSALVASSEEKLHRADLKNGEYKMLVNIDNNGIETPKNTGKLAPDEAITGLENDGEPANYMLMDIHSKDKATKLVAGIGSPSNMGLSRTKVKQDILISEISPKRTLVTSGTRSLLLNDGETKLQRHQIESETFRIAQTPSRDTTILNFQLESSEEHHKTGASPLLSVSSISGSTSEPSPLKSPSNKGSTWSSPRKVPTQRSSRNSSDQKAMRQEPTPSSPMKGPTQSPSTKEPTQRSSKKEASWSPPRKEQSQSPCKRELTWSSLMNELPQFPSIKEPAQNCPRKELMKGLSRLETSSPAQSDIVQSFVGKDIVSPHSNSNVFGNDGCHQELHISHSPFVTRDLEISSQKRSIGVGFDDRNHADNIPRIQRSPDVHRNGNYDSAHLLHHSDRIDSEREKTEDDRTLTNWSDFLVKFSRDTRQLLSPSIDKLNLRTISVLEDTLVHLLKARKYEIFSSEIQSQKVTGCFNIRQKRIVEAKFLLSKIAYETAKLQLMCAKHEKLLKRTQLLSSGIQECQRLQLNYIQQKSESGRKGTPLQSHSVNFEGENQVVCNNISTMKKEIKVLDAKIKSLSNFFHSYCKLKGEPSSTNTVTLAQDHVKTRTCGRLLRQDLQLWKVDDFKSRNGHYTILLNYQGYLSQRFTLKFGPASNIVVSNELNVINIVKNFPNMDAPVAFAFVLNPGAAKRGVSSKCLVQETQVIRSLLCNLFNVVEELQMAQIEVGNLIETTFHCPSVEQLDLQLCFVNYNSGRKVTLTLDVTCLNRGIYPSEILPYQVQDPTGRARNSESLLVEINSAADNLEAGLLRILRLGRCIAQVMQPKST
nr:uncharacterized protein LOC107416792 isoform X1 [Ziziphus jujuba var. spinosa]